jgi:hypothetical protein
MGRALQTIGQVLCVVSCAFSSADDGFIRLGHNGYASLDAGQIVAGQWKQERIDYVWQNRLVGGYSVSANVGPRLQVNVSLECRLAFGMVNERSNYATAPESYIGQFIF